MFLQSLLSNTLCNSPCNGCLHRFIHGWTINKSVIQLACTSKTGPKDQETQSIVYMFSTQSVFQDDETVHDQGGSKNLEKSSSNRTSILKKKKRVSCSWAFYWTSCSKIIFCKCYCVVYETDFTECFFVFENKYFPKVFKDILLELL